MADRQRWLWAVVRLAKRNRWTLFGSFAALTVFGDAIVAAIFFFDSPAGNHRGPTDFFVPFAVLSILAIIFWTAMAFGNLFLERRGKALRTEEGIEVLAGVRLFTESLKPPSFTSIVVVAVIIGSLAWLGTGFPSGLATAAIWLIGGVFVRWAWSKPSTPTWRLAVVSAMAGLGVFALDLFKGLFRAGGTINEAVIAGGIAASVAFVFALIMKRLSTPSANSVSRLALDIRDRALTLASDDVHPNDAARDLLAATKGRRAAAEVAWDILRKRPKSDPVNVRAWALVDRAIREGEWGWWPWGRDKEDYE
jgi:hypothetical protein